MSKVPRVLKDAGAEWRGITQDRILTGNNRTNAAHKALLLGNHHAQPGKSRPSGEAQNIQGKLRKRVPEQTKRFSRARSAQPIASRQAETAAIGGLLRVAA